MPNRFPISESPDPSTREMVEGTLAKMLGASPPYPWIDEDGESLTGCLAPLCYTPTVTKQFFEVGKSCYHPSFLAPRKRELSILGLVSAINAPYIVHRHEEVAARVGLSPTQYQDAKSGKVPTGLDEGEQAVYDLARTLGQLNEPMDDATWSKFSSQMTKTEIVAVVHIVGAYRWIALLAQINGT